jgi:hypothetical protein
LWLGFVGGGLLACPRAERKQQRGGASQNGEMASSLPSLDEQRGSLTLVGSRPQQERGKEENSRRGGSATSPPPKKDNSGLEEPLLLTTPAATRAVLPAWRQMLEMRKRRGLVVGVRPLPFSEPF